MIKRFIGVLCFIALVCNMVLYYPGFSFTANAAKTITVFSQTDSRWGSHQYGYSNTAGTTPATISSGGCGILAYVNAVYYLNGKFIEPITLADWSVSNGYRINGVGTSLGLYAAFANAKGSVYSIAYNGSSSSYDTLRQHLQNGEVAIGSAPGHLMAVVDYDSSNGKFLILDSYKSSNRQTYSTGYTWQTAASCKSISKLNFSSFYFIKSTGPVTPDPTPSLVVNTAFPSNIKAYTIGTGNQAVYAVAGGSAESGRYITGSTDLCTIKQVYTNGWCLVNYPSGSTTRDAYVPLSYFINSGVSHSSGTGLAATVYRRSDMGESLGSVYASDTYTIVGASGSKKQIIYPISGGYKMGWVIIADALPADNSFPANIKAYTIATGNQAVYSEAGGAAESGRYITGSTDLCTIKQVYSNGWCLVNYPTSSGSRDAFVPFSYFVNSGVNHYTGKGVNVNVYRRSDLAETLGTVYAADTYTVVGKSGDKIQMIYPLDAGGYKMGWVSSSALDSTKPTVSNVKIAASDNTSFTVTATATDNQSVQSVRAAVWTDSNGQDDLIWYDMTNTSGSSYTKKVNISDHGNQTGNYIIHVYAYDVAGNNSAVGITHNFQIKYNVSFNANGGEGAPETQVKIKGTALALSSVKPVRDGFIFQGWAINQAASVAAYQPGDSYTGDADIALYAVWAADVPDTPNLMTVGISTTSAKVGEDIYVDINIFGESPISGGNFTLQYDNNAFEVKNAAKGSYITDNGFSAEINENYSNNMVRMSFAGTENVSPSGKLCRITFTPIKSVSSANFDLVSSKLANSSGTIIEVYVNNASVAVSGEITTATTTETTTETTTQAKTETTTETTTQAKTETTTEAVVGDKAVIKVGSGTAVPGGYIDVPVTISNNKGFCYFKIVINYDNSKLIPISYTKGSDFSSILSNMDSSDADMSKLDAVNFVWDSLEDITSDNTMFTVRFSVAEGAAKGTSVLEIDTELSNMYNVNLDTLSYTAQNGVITISDVIKGDVNGDSVVNGKDIIKLRQYLAGWANAQLDSTALEAADVNSDTAVNGKDLIKIRQYLAGWPGVIL